MVLDLDSKTVVCSWIIGEGSEGAKTTELLAFIAPCCLQL